jgi:DNA-binding transcriptional regulator YhcF (GntR family)
VYSATEGLNSQGSYGYLVKYVTNAAEANVIEEGRALFLQIAESVEDSIIGGALAEEERAPSTNELAAFYRINPATAAKGVNVLVDRGVLYKRRGIGMFVAPGARDRLLGDRRTSFAERFVDPLLDEGRRLGLDADDLSRLILDRARTRRSASDATEGAS